MNRLISLLRDCHCRATHHYLAVDALPLVQTAAGIRLVGWLLRYHRRYLAGTEDPDLRFRDFQNHVVHMGEGGWGGAPRVAQQWYHRLQRYLRSSRWSDAAHAAGVLSHYFTDPMQPLHTDLDDRDTVLHHPIEWSIACSYQELYRRWVADDTRVVFQLSDRPEWLGDAIWQSARWAHHRRARLMDGYRLDRALVDPRDGLVGELPSLLADVVGLAVTGWARILERSAEEAEQAIRHPLPTAPRVLPLGLALLRAPVGIWRQRIYASQERARIEGLVQEFRETGAVRDRLPAELFIVRRVSQILREERERQAARNRHVAAPPATASIRRWTGSDQASADRQQLRSGQRHHPRRAA